MTIACKPLYLSKRHGFLAKFVIICRFNRKKRLFVDFILTFDIDYLSL